MPRRLNQCLTAVWAILLALLATSAPALGQAGTAWTWGSNYSGQLGDGIPACRSTPVQVKSPDGTDWLTGVVALAGGNGHTVALKADGTVWAWGDNYSGQLGDGTTTSRARPVQVKGPEGDGWLTGVIAVAAGDFHTLALKADGTVWAWGWNGYGELGDGTTTDRPTPVQVTGLADVVAIASRGYHSVALKNDNKVWAWGANWYGELGDGTTDHSSTPVQVKGPDGTDWLTGVTAVAAGTHHTLARKDDGTLWAWGDNSYGQLGDGTADSRSRPVQVTGLADVVAVSAGYGYNVALKTGGTVWAWGANWYGQFGDGTCTPSSTPVQVKGPDGTDWLTGVAAVAAGDGHTLARKADGTVWAWGSNWQGQLGDGTSDCRLTPVQVKGPGGTGFLAEVLAVAAGGYHTLALKTDGTVWACGSNYCGQLGDGTPPLRFTPIQVRGPDGTDWLTDVVAVAGRGSHTLALKADGTAWAWGANWGGQLGDGTATDGLTPVQVKGPGGTDWLTGVVAVTAGVGHNAALKTDGTVWAWGDNGYGQLGNGIPAPSATPVQVQGPGGVDCLTGVVAVAGGFNHTVALRFDGTVWAWGCNWQGQLGDGTVMDRWTPVQVRDPSGTEWLTDVVAVAAGDFYTLALKTDGTVWAWGANWCGQLGDGTATDSLTPVQVKGPGGAGSLTGVLAIASGGAHAVALKDDGTVWTWGDNWQGQLGDDTNMSTLTPVQVKGPGGADWLTGVLAVAAGSGHTTALKADGTAWAWGDNYSGQLGDGTTTDSWTPVQVKTSDGAGWLADVGALAAGDAHTIALLGPRPTYTLTVAAQPAHGGTAEPASPVAGCPWGLPVALMATPEPGWIFAGWTGDVASVMDPTAADTICFMTGNAAVTAQFVQEGAGVLEITGASISPDWAFQNTASTVVNKHYGLLTVSVNDTWGSTSYTVTVTKTDGSGDVTVADTANDLQKRLYGSLRTDGITGTGTCQFSVRVQGDLGGDETVPVSTTFKVRRLGDINNDNAVTTDDSVWLTKKLNNLNVDPLVQRDFDVTGDDFVTTDDAVLLTKILNNLAIP